MVPSGTPGKETGQFPRGLRPSGMQKAVDIPETLSTAYKVRREQSP